MAMDADNPRTSVAERIANAAELELIKEYGYENTVVLNDLEGRIEVFDDSCSTTVVIKDDSV